MKAAVLVGSVVACAALIPQLPPDLENSGFPSLLPSIVKHPVVQQFVCGGPSKQGCPSHFNCRLRPGECISDPTSQGICTPAPLFCFFGKTKVCGCDGEEYDSSCEAYKNGTNVASFGDCKGHVDMPTPFIVVPIPYAVPDNTPIIRGGCNISDACPKHQYCRYERCNDVDSQGQCVNIPLTCPATTNKAPVCGCDGFTYESECMAARAVESVRSQGPCPLVPVDVPVPEGDSFPPCSNTHGMGCADPRAMCLWKEPGNCGSTDVSKVCMVPDELNYCRIGSVCGCNGVTYLSECVAWNNGQSVAYYGECQLPSEQPGSPPPPIGPTDGGSPARSSCVSTDDCLSTEYCVMGPGCEGLGFCQEGPECKDGHATIYGPFLQVCGCDQVLYDDPCQLQQYDAEATLDMTFCNPTPRDCDDDTDCTAGQFCDLAGTRCGDVSDMGYCTNIPESCPQDTADEWVCGCNSRLYRTKCDATLERVSVGPYENCANDSIWFRR